MHPPGTNPYLFNGKIALVTGGTSGIGKAIVAALAKAGALVCTCGRREELGEDQAKAMRSEGQRVEFVKTDVTDEAAVQKLIKQIIERHGRLDFVINNAGLEAEAEPLVETSIERFRKVIDVNVTGSFLVTKHAIPALRAGGGGAIVNLASVLGQIAMPNSSAYVTAKHAVVGLTKAAAIEEAPHKIRVNAVAPGAVNTDMLYRAIQDSDTALQQVKALHPLGRIAEPEEIAEAVIWLCSDGSAFITGQVINVDGGFTAQ